MRNRDLERERGGKTDRQTDRQTAKKKREKESDENR